MKIGKNSSGKVQKKNGKAVANGTAACCCGTSGGEDGDDNVTTGDATTLYTLYECACYEIPFPACNPCPTSYYKEGSEFSNPARVIRNGICLRRRGSAYGPTGILITTYSTPVSGDCRCTLDACGGIRVTYAGWGVTNGCYKSGCEGDSEYIKITGVRGTLNGVTSDPCGGPTVILGDGRGEAYNTRSGSETPCAGCDGDSCEYSDTRYYSVSTIVDIGNPGVGFVQVTAGTIGCGDGVTDGNVAFKAANVTICDIKNAGTLVLTNTAPTSPILPWLQVGSIIVTWVPSCC